jgi:hypothetical protein
VCNCAFLHLFRIAALPARGSLSRASYPLRLIGRRASGRQPQRGMPQDGDTRMSKERTGGGSSSQGSRPWGRLLGVWRSRSLIGCAAAAGDAAAGPVCAVQPPVDLGGAGLGGSGSARGACGSACGRDECRRQSVLVAVHPLAVAARPAGFRAQGRATADAGADRPAGAGAGLDGLVGLPAGGQRRACADGRHHGRHDRRGCAGDGGAAGTGSGLGGACRAQAPWPHWWPVAGRWCR